MMASPLHRVAALGAYREARKALKTTVVRMQLEGANPAPAIAASDKLVGKTNYFVGNDPQKWVTGVPSYGRVKYSGIYPGVDVEFYGNQRRLEYDFTVAPGANPKAITLKIDGAKKLVIDSHGDLILHIPDGDVELQKPVVYQIAAKERREVAGNYVLGAGNRVTFAVAKYDHSLPLVIDPVLSPLLSYATYLGGTGDESGNGIAVDGNGDAFIGGMTSSTDFPPTTNTAPISGCGFVTELNPAGASQLYSSYLCGSDTAGDSVFALALDSTGKVYATGLAVSGNFPTTANALIQAPITNTNGTAFVTKIDPTLSGAASLVYSSYVGGTNGDFANGVAADASGNAYIGGITFSNPGAAGSGGFPVMNAFQATAPSDIAVGAAFLTRIDTTQSGNASLIYSTYLGGNGANVNNTFANFGDQIFGVAADTSNNAYVTGVTTSTNFPPVSAFQGTAIPGNSQGGGFVARIDTTKSGTPSLAYSTYLEGSVSDAALAIALGPNNVAYVTGTTNSLDFHFTPGAFQTSQSGGGVAFITLVDTTMSGNSSVPYSTFFGGSGGDTGFGIAADSSGNAYVGGTTASGDFPITPNVIPRTPNNPNGTPFVVKLSPKGNGTADRIYATYFGGFADAANPPDADQGNAIAIDSHGNAYITGQMFSPTMPTTAGAFQTAPSGPSDAFVAKLPLILPVLVLPSSIDFGTQLVGATTAPQTVTLTNNNTTALTINSIAVVAVMPAAAGTDYKISSNTCPASLPAGMSCTVNVTFTPSVASAESANLTFTDSDTSTRKWRYSRAPALTARRW
jgi:Beta-propeller repeat